MGFIYFIQEGNEGKIKIGFSEDPKERLKTLKIANPNNLRIIFQYEGSEADERKIHRMFKNYNISGEWFEPSEEIMEFINVTKDSYQVNRIHQLGEEFTNIKKSIKKLEKSFDELENRIHSLNDQKNENFLEEYLRRGIEKFWHGTDDLYKDFIDDVDHYDRFDNLVMRKVLSHILGFYPYEVATETDGEENNIILYECLIRIKNIKKISFNSSGRPHDLIFDGYFSSLMKFEIVDGMIFSFMPEHQSLLEYLWRLTGFDETIPNFDHEDKIDKNVLSKFQEHIKNYKFGGHKEFSLTAGLAGVSDNRFFILKTEDPVKQLKLSENHQKELDPIIEIL